MTKKKEKKAAEVKKRLPVKWMPWDRSGDSGQYACLGSAALDVATTEEVWARTILGKVYIVRINSTHENGTDGRGWLAILVPQDTLLPHELRFETKSLEDLKLHFEVRHEDELDERLSDLNVWLP